MHTSLLPCNFLPTYIHTYTLVGFPCATGVSEWTGRAVATARGMLRCCSECFPRRTCQDGIRWQPASHLVALQLAAADHGLSLPATSHKTSFVACCRQPKSGSSTTRHFGLCVFLPSSYPTMRPGLRERCWLPCFARPSPVECNLRLALGPRQSVLSASISARGCEEPARSRRLWKLQRGKALSEEQCTRKTGDYSQTRLAG